MSEKLVKILRDIAAQSDNQPDAEAILWAVEVIESVGTDPKSLRCPWCSEPITHHNKTSNNSNAR